MIQKDVKPFPVSLEAVQHLFAGFRQGRAPQLRIARPRQSPERPAQFPIPGGKAFGLFSDLQPTPVQIDLAP